MRDELTKQKNEETPKGQLILRDRLAENRTVLANERTLLSYVRTSLAIIAAGISFIHFFHYTAVVVLGWVLLPVGAYTLIKGFASFRNMNRIMRKEEDQEVLRPKE